MYVKKMKMREKNGDQELVGKSDETENEKNHKFERQEKGKNGKMKLNMEEQKIRREKGFDVRN